MYSDFMDIETTILPGLHCIASLHTFIVSTVVLLNSIIDAEKKTLLATLLVAIHDNT